ncbi:MAG: bifunctional adenosylcobinamide kinase/adenosylcobinamide-phosphate guanylyltransferase [Chloroflexi bacterium]|nr:bifunctional adenosylcobinamide kinase/adenosylcobinamide-phosphate guanylyltransferase [Chloroflexota bacterium]
MAEITLILGGARSGKSRLAVELATRLPGPALFVATAQAGDAEMAERIAKHREARPPGWRTMESPLGLGARLAQEQGEARAVVIDCLSFLVANALGEGDPGSLARVQEEMDSLLTTLERSSAHFLVVSNEVGLGLVPPYPLGRAYRDALGAANQRLAQRAHRVILTVAGIPMTIKGPPLP